MRLYLISTVLFFGLMTSQALAFAGQEETIEITVSQKDWLINLCKKYLEDPRKWRSIAKLNRLSNPNIIMPGQVIKVPVSLLKGTAVEGVVVFLKGEAMIKKSEREGWRGLHMNDVVTEGSAIRTGEKSVVEISSEDGVTFILRANSALLMKKSKKTAAYYMRRILLETGQVSSKIKSATGRKSRYEVQTPSAVAAARGTEFRVSVDQQKATRSEVLEGEVLIGAQNREVILTEGEGTIVKMNEPPSKPRKLLPPPGPVSVKPLYTAEIEVSFTEVAGAEAYEVVLSRDKTGKDSVVEMIIRPGEPFVATGIEAGVYYLAVMAIDPEGLHGPASQPFEITVDTPKKTVAPPIIQNPLQGEQFSVPSVHVKWLESEGAARYRLQISPDYSFSDSRIEAYFWGTQYLIKDLEYRKYYLRMSSISDKNEEGEWSEIREFVTVPPAPAVRDTESENIAIEWEDFMKGAPSYEVQIARDEAFNLISSTARSNSGSLSVPRPAAGVYFVRVRPVYFGIPGSFSVPYRFEIPSR